MQASPPTNLSCPPSEFGGNFHPLETCVTPTDGWYHWNKFKVDAKGLFDIYLKSVGSGAVNTINMVPDTRGLIPENQVELFTNVGNAIRQSFDKNISASYNLTGLCSQPFDVTLNSPTTFSGVMMIEDLTQGQRIAAYSLSYKTSQGDWVPFQAIHGQTIGAKLIDVVGNITTTAVRFQCKQSLQDPIRLKSISLHNVVYPKE
eukprot:m.222944 g.222944  ORF g.222944 m.222944 type:complete len:203 (+) comp26335_c1_seq12:1075-1683(+)